MKRPGLKKASKRQTLHQKHKIAKKVREHNRQQRKLQKQGKPLNAGSKYTKRTRDPGIPNNTPFSDEILKEAQQYKENQEKLKEEMREKQRKWQQLQFKRKQQGFSSVEEMLAKAEADKASHEKKEREKMVEADQTSENAANKKEGSNFWRQVNSVINDADVILHILDARDPEATRCKAIEKAVNSRDDKKLVLVLNKIDLIPAEAAKAWLKFYRRTFGPCIAFRASSQKQKSNITQKNSAGKISKEVAGTTSILNLLANYGKHKDETGTSKVRTAVTVGIVGLPNVGKSSIINTLKRNKSCKVGDEPGVTRNLQTILIDSHVKLIDSPGVVLPTENKTKASVISKVLLNAQHAGSVDNSRTAAIEILRRVDDYESLALHYRLELPDPAKNSPDYFLAVLARRKGWLKKGAVPDINAACRFLLKQWTSGDLQFHTMPPKLTGQDDSDNEMDSNKGGAKIKSAFGQELDAEMLLNNDSDDEMSSSKFTNNILFKIKDENAETDYKVDIKNSGNRKRKIKFEDEDMEGENQNPGSSSKGGEIALNENVDEFNTNYTNKERKKLLKKRQKKMKKSNQDMEPVIDELENLMEGV